MTKPEPRTPDDPGPGAGAGEPAAPQPREHVTTGRESLAQFAAEHGTSPSAVIGATAAAGLPPDFADHLDEVFRATRSVVSPMPEGLRLLLPAEGAS